MSGGSVEWGAEAPNQPPPVKLTVEPPPFDIFLAYNSKDADAKRCMQAIARSLTAQGFCPWNDEGETRIGGPSDEAVVTGIEQSKCFAMLLGAGGSGDWQGETELRTAIGRRNADQTFRIFAVLLPGYPVDAEFPKALKPYGWADLRNGFDEQSNLTPDGFAEVQRAITYETRSELERHQAGASPARPGRHRALLCGVAHYTQAEFDELNSPLNDIKHLADALRAAGAPEGDWEISFELDPTTSQLRTALERLFTRDAVRADTLLFYFSGHGRAPSRASYLCAADSEPDRLSLNGFGDNQLLELLSTCPAAGKVAILDCCEGARIRNSAFEDLDETAAVVVATHGLAADGSHDGDLSKFARRLVDVIQRPGRFGENGLDVRGLIQALEQPDGDPRLYGRGTAIRLTRAAPAIEAIPEPAEPPLAIEMALPDEPDRRNELDRQLVVLRQLGSSVEGLLAIAEKRTTFPEELINESVKVLSGELCRLMGEDSYRQLTGRVRDAQERVRCELSFRGEDDRALFGDLPWEYLALHLDEPSPKLGLVRAFAANPKGGSSGGTEIGWFSSLDVTDTAGERLTAVADAALNDSEPKRAPALIPTCSTTWTMLSSAPDTKRGLILQVPVQLVERAGKQVVEITMVDESVDQAEYGDLPVTPDALATVLDRKRSVTWVVIETVIHECGKQTALALRRLATELADRLNGRTVIAIGHPLAYVNAIQPMQPVFLVKFIERVQAGAPPEVAAYLARDDTISPVIKPSMVGVPIIMRPKRAEDAGRFARSTSQAARLRG